MGISRGGGSRMGGGGALGKQVPMIPALLPFLVFFFFSFLSFFGPHLWHTEVPRLGDNQSYSCRPTPQPQQRQIQAASVTYTTAPGNTRSLTHCVGPGIEPATSWFLVGLVTAELQRELLKSFLSKDLKVRKQAKQTYRGTSRQRKQQVQRP